MERNQFTFYKSFAESIENLPTNKEKLQAYEAIIRYALYGTEPDLNRIKPSVATVFRLTRPVLSTARRRAEAYKRATDPTRNYADELLQFEKGL